MSKALLPTIGSYTIPALHSPLGWVGISREGEGVGTRGYYGVLPSDRIVPYIHGVYNIVSLRVGDSGLVVTPLIQDGTYPVRRIATLGPRVLVVQVYLQPPFPVTLHY